MNRSPSAAINQQIPQEVWSNQPVDYSGLKIFGCPAYAHTRDGKLEPRAKKCMFIGYAQGVKGYRLWCIEDPRSPKIIISRDVIFDEDALLNQRRKSDSDRAESDHGAKKQVELVELTEEDQHNEKEIQPEQIEEPYSIARNRERRDIRPPMRFTDTVAYALNLMDSDPVSYALVMVDDVVSDDPYTYKEAISGRESVEWIAAMTEEIESLRKNQTWELVPLPRGKKVVGCKWVYKKKEGIPGVEPPRFKGKRLYSEGGS